MVGRLAQGVDDLNFAGGVYGGAEEDFLEEVGADEAGAGEGGEEAAGVEEAHRQPVEVFVAAGGGVDVAFAVGEFGGVEDDDVEAAICVAVVAQELEGVGDNIFVLRPFVAV